MEFQQHLFNRRELVILLLDLDDETLNRVDFALPSPPYIAQTNLATHSPPQTRLDVARAALISFVNAKLLSAPTSSHVSFGLYSVNKEGRRDEDVVELVPPTSSGSASGRAVQDALRGLTTEFYLSRTHAAAAAADGFPQKNTVEKYDSSCSGSCAEAPPYCGVLRRLHELKDTADVQQRHEQQQQFQVAHSLATSPAITTASGTPRLAPRRGNTSFDKSGVVSTTRGKVKAQENSQFSGNACVVVHGIAVRSHSAPPPNLAFPAKSNDTSQPAHEEELAESRVWLDVIVFDGSLEASATPINAVDLAPTRECFVRGCRCALLDPVELTGIQHRGLALGPALVRVMPLPEARTFAFVHRPLSVLKILHTPSTSDESTALFAAASSKFTHSLAPAAVSDKGSTLMLSQAPHGRSTPQQPDSPRGCDSHNGCTSAMCTGTGSFVGGAAVMNRSGIGSNALAPTSSKKPPPSQQPRSGSPRAALPQLSSGSATQDGTADATLVHHPSASASPANTHVQKEKNAVTAAILPTVVRKNLSVATPPKRPQPVVKDEEQRAYHTMPCTSSIADDSANVREISAVTVASSAHRYAVSSPDVLSSIRDEDSTPDEEVLHRPSNDPQRLPATLVKLRRAVVTSGGLPTPNLTGQGSEIYLGCRRLPSSPQNISTNTPESPASTSGKHITKQAPLAFAKQPPQQSSSCTLEPTPPHTLFTPQFPRFPMEDNTQVISPLPYKRNGDDSASAPKTSDAVNAGTPCVSPPPPFGAAGRRASAAGTQIQQAPPPPLSGGGVVDDGRPNLPPRRPRQPSLPQR